MMLHSMLIGLKAKYELLAVGTTTKCSQMVKYHLTKLVTLTWIIDICEH